MKLRIPPEKKYFGNENLFGMECACLIRWCEAAACYSHVSSLPLEKEIFARTSNTYTKRVETLLSMDPNSIYEYLNSFRLPLEDITQKNQSKLERAASFSVRASFKRKNKKDTFIYRYDLIAENIVRHIEELDISRPATSSHSTNSRPQTEDTEQELSTKNNKLTIETKVDETFSYNRSITKNAALYTETLEILRSPTTPHSTNSRPQTEGTKQELSTKNNKLPIETKADTPPITRRSRANSW